MDQKNNKQQLISRLENLEIIVEKLEKTIELLIPQFVELSHKITDSDLENMSKHFSTLNCVRLFSCSALRCIITHPPTYARPSLELQHLLFFDL